MVLRNWIRRLHWLRHSTTPFTCCTRQLRVSTAVAVTQLVPRAVARARTLSAVGDLPHALLYAALGAATAGYLDQAGPQAAEGLQIARETGQETLAAALLAALAKVAALRGEEEECRSRARESLAMAIPRRLGLAVALASEALGLLDLSLGRPEEALHRFQTIATAEPGAGHPFVAMTTTSYLVEAAVRSDHRDVAERVAPSSAHELNTPPPVNSPLRRTAVRWLGAFPPPGVAATESIKPMPTSRRRCGC